MEVTPKSLCYPPSNPFFLLLLFSFSRPMKADLSSLGFFLRRTRALSGLGFVKEGMPFQWSIGELLKRGLFLRRSPIVSFSLDPPSRSTARRARQWFFFAEESFRHFSFVG